MEDHLSRLEKGALHRISESPRLFMLPAFESPKTCALLTDLCRDEAALAAAEVALRREGNGTSCELPLDLHPVLGDLARRLDAALGLENRVPHTLRMRRYARRGTPRAPRHLSHR